MITRPILRAAAVSTVAVLTLSACGNSNDVRAFDGAPPPMPSEAASEPASHVTADNPSGWSKVAPWPYAPWFYSVAVWTGTEVLVFGQAAPPETRDQVGQRTGDAAGAYNPTSNTWRPIATAPFDVRLASAVGAPGVAYATSSKRLGVEVWEYSVEADTWRELPVPDGQLPGHLALAGNTLALTEDGAGPTGRPIQLLDIDTKQWRAAPADPWPSSEQQALAGLPDGRLVLLETPGGDLPTPPPVTSGRDGDGIVVTTTERQPRSPHNPAPCWHAAILDPAASGWHEMSRSGIAALDPWTQWDLVRGHLVSLEAGTLGAESVTPGCGTGAEVPVGGVLDIDADRWEPLVGVPADFEPEWGNPQPSGGPVALSDQWTYDPTTWRWTALPPLLKEGQEYGSTLRVWAGNQLLVFANTRYRTDEDGFPTKTQRVRVGWSWTPGGH